MSKEEIYKTIITYRTDKSYLQKYLVSLENESWGNDYCLCFFSRVSKLNLSIERHAVCFEQWLDRFIDRYKTERG